MSWARGHPVAHLTLHKDLERLNGRLVKIVAVCSISLSVLVGLGGWGYVRLRLWATTPIALPVNSTDNTSNPGQTGAQIISVSRGIPLRSLATTLEAQGLINDALLFQLWVRVDSSYSQFQAGKYRFTQPVAPKDITDAMVDGAVYHDVVLQYAIPEGFPLKMTLDRLAARGIGTIKELQQLAADPGFLHELKVPSSSLEGYIYPATYSFTSMPSAAEALQTMVKTFWRHLPKDYQSDIKARGLTLNQAVAFASLIELETLHDDEKTLISEVIWRRLKDKVPLGIDAAIIYGIPDYQGDLRWKHLQDAGNPYNTRIHRGLPPTAIGSPSAASLAAVLTPANFGYYYYVLTPGSNRHVFSRTLAEHNEHVKALVGEHVKPPPAKPAAVKRRAPKRGKNKNSERRKTKLRSRLQGE